MGEPKIASVAVLGNVFVESKQTTYRHNLCECLKEAAGSMIAPVRVGGRGVVTHGTGSRNSLINRSEAMGRVMRGNAAPVL